MIRHQLTLFTLLFLLLPACEQREPTPPPSPARSPQEQQSPSPPTAPQGGQSWQGLAGADKVSQQIDPQEGGKIYSQVCATCHGEGVAGAPRLDDRQHWQERIGKGLPTLIAHSIDGFQGNLGVMPPKGGVQSLSDDQVASAVVYMVQQVQTGQP